MEGRSGYRTMALSPAHPTLMSTMDLKARHVPAWPVFSARNPDEFDRADNPSKHWLYSPSFSAPATSSPSASQRPCAPGDSGTAADEPFVHQRTIRRPEPRRFVPLANTAIYEMEQRGEFPQRFRRTPRSVLWSLAEVETWITERRAASDANLRRGRQAPTCDAARPGQWRAEINSGQVAGNLRRFRSAGFQE